MTSPRTAVVDETATSHAISSNAIWISAGLMLLAQSSQVLVFGGLSLFLPLIQKDAHLSFSQAGALAGISTAVYALMQIPSGYLADRFGPKRLYVVGVLAVNLLGISFAQMHTFNWMALNQALSGFFRSLVFAPGMILMVAHFSERRRSTATSLYLVGGVSSNIVLSSIGPVLVRELGWRQLFEVFSAIGVAITFAFWLFGIRDPERRADRPPFRAVIDLFRMRAMWLMGAIQYIRLAVAYGVAVWLPSYVVVDKHYSLQIAGLVVAIMAATAVPANLIGGYLGDRLKEQTRIISVAMAGLAVCLVLLVQVHSLALLVVDAAVLGTLMQVYFGPLFAIPVKIWPGTAGAATGFGNFFANMGGFTFAITIGTIKDATGSFAVSLYVLSGVCLLGPLLSWMLSMEIRRRREALSRA